jgi:ribosomal protein S18 acetylase RimI-like enzyme
MNITIEPVEQADVKTLGDISKKTFYDTFFEHNTAEDMQLFLDTTFNLESLQQELSDKSNKFFFAKSDGEIAGYLKLSDNKKPAALENINALEISRIYCLTEKLGQGIGKTLLTFAIELAKNSNKETVWLGVWEHNQKAIGFYKSFGFQKFSEHIFMVGADAQTDWLMKLDF